MAKFEMDGTLRGIVWPIYVGAVLVDGSEPMSNPDYTRGFIAWRQDDGEIVGRTEVLVPPGEYGWLIYTYHPSAAFFSASQRFSHPVTVGPGGSIRLERITSDDFDLANQALRGGVLEE